MIILKKEVDIPTEQNYFKSFMPLTWRHFQGSVVIVCANDHYLSIYDPAKKPEDCHKITPDGSVSPSVVCPVEGCGFHEMIKLEGWQAT